MTDDASAKWPRALGLAWIQADGVPDPCSVLEAVGTLLFQPARFAANEGLLDEARALAVKIRDAEITASGERVKRMQAVRYAEDNKTLARQLLKTVGDPEPKAHRAHRRRRGPQQDLVQVGAEAVEAHALELAELFAHSTLRTTGIHVDPSDVVKSARQPRRAEDPAEPRDAITKRLGWLDGSSVSKASLERFKHVVMAKTYRPSDPLLNLVRLVLESNQDAGDDDVVRDEEDYLGRGSDERAAELDGLRAAVSVLLSSARCGGLLTDKDARWLDWDLSTDHLDNQIADLAAFFGALAGIQCRSLTLRFEAQDEEWWSELIDGPNGLMDLVVSDSPSLAHGLLDDAIGSRQEVMDAWALSHAADAAVSLLHKENAAPSKCVTVGLRRNLATAILRSALALKSQADLETNAPQTLLDMLRTGAAHMHRLAKELDDDVKRESEPTE